MNKTSPHGYTYFFLLKHMVTHIDNNNVLKLHKPYKSYEFMLLKS